MRIIRYLPNTIVEYGTFVSHLVLTGTSAGARPLYPGDGAMVDVEGIVPLENEVIKHG